MSEVRVGHIGRMRRQAETAWPLGSIASGAVFVVVAVASFVASKPSGGAYAEWVTVSGSTHESLLLVGPVIAFAAGFAGYLLAGRASIFYGQAVGHRKAQLIRHIARLSLGSLVAMVIGWAPSWLWAARTATWGSPSGWDLLITITGVVLITTVSFVVGSMLRRQEWVVVLPIACGLLLLSPRWLDRALSVIDPVQSWTSSVRFSPNPAISMYFLVFAAFVVLCAGALFANQHGRHIAVPEIAAAVVALVVLVAVPFMWRPDLYTLRHVAPSVCQQAESTAVCVHPGHQKALAGIVNAVSSLHRAAGTPLVERVTDEATASSLTPQPGEVLVTITPTTTTNSIAFQLVFAGTGQEMCGHLYPQQEGKGVAAANLSAAIGSRILRDVGDSGGAANMAQPILDQRAIRAVNRLEPERFHNLLRSQKRRIERCDLTYAGVQ